MALTTSQLDGLGHVLESARRIADYLAGLERPGFEADPRTQDAVIRRLEIMAAACGRLGPAFHAAHPAVPWRQVRDMRNFLAHAYDRVDLEVVWNTARRDVPALLAAVAAIYVGADLPVPSADLRPGADRV